MPMKPRQIIKLLKENGFIEKSQNGSSHLKMYNPSTNATVMVPIHAKELGKGLETAILREANLKKQQFLQCTQKSERFLGYQKLLDISLIDLKGGIFMKKDMVIYPAIFSKDGDYIFVRIPDLKGGFTQGNDVIDAVNMSEDLIGNLLEDQTNYPEPSEIDPASLKPDEKLFYITVDLTAFRREFSRTVRKNVTIPEYLNDMAKSQRLNVSQVLTNALKTELGVQLGEAQHYVGLFLYIGLGGASMNMEDNEATHAKDD